MIRKIVKALKHEPVAHETGINVHHYNFLRQMTEAY